MRRTVTGMIAALAIAAVQPPAHAADAHGAEVLRPGLFGLDTGLWLFKSYITARDVRAATQANATWVRLIVSWEEIEPHRGRFDFSKLDRWVGRLARAGLSIDATVAGSPRYACRRPRPADRFSCPPRLRPYRAFLTRLVARYKREIKHWEIWNEPNDATFWHPRPNPAAYATLLKAAYVAIKRTDRRAKVLMAATGPIPDENGNEIDPSDTYMPYMQFTARTLAALGGTKAFDLIALHPYRGAKGPYETRGILPEDGTRANVTLKEELLRYRDLFARYGYGDNRLWITEMGWGAAPDDQTSAGLTTHAQQAQFLEELYTQVGTDPELDFVETVFWWSLRDVPAVEETGVFAHYGLLNRDYTPKPAFETYRRLAAGQ